MTNGLVPIPYDVHGVHDVQTPNEHPGVGELEVDLQSANDRTSHDGDEPSET